MNSNTLIIDGGLGRVITAIPALEKFVKKNPDSIIITYGWTAALFGNKILSNKILDSATKNLYERIKDTKIYKPEPYFNSDYLNGKISLADAWNQEINGDREKMPIPKLYVKKDEVRRTQVKKPGKKVIAFQPFGSTAEVKDNEVIDGTYRSLNVKFCKEIISALRNEDYTIWLMTDKVVPFIKEHEVLNYFPKDLREVVAAVSQCDYFLGIDSSGQHIARAFNIPGSVIMGGTNTTNVTYPDFFNIVNDRENRSYMPYRVAEFDWWLSEIYNDKIMDFTDQEMKLMAKDIVRHIKKSSK